MKDKLKYSIVLIFLFLLSNSLWATPRPPQPTPPPGMFIPGIFVAMSAAIAYGIYRLRNTDKRK